MNHGSLFSGIGGFDLAAEWMGWNNIFHCEWNEFAQKILKHHWPNTISYGDITKTDFTIHRGNIDILTGGFPCQPFSQAGLRKGTEDERHLWPHMLRAIREIQPNWIVGENVYGLTNWNEGVVFDQVLIDLETEGYKTQSYLLPACAVNSPQKRYRIYIVAYSDKVQWKPLGERGIQDKFKRSEEIGCESWAEFELVGNGTVFEGWKHPKFGNDTQPFLCRSGDGIPDWMDTYQVMGNAIVPQVALMIYKAIAEYMHSSNSEKKY